jgi:SpoVK/Ycf46/Vps4 family AAA+-type ATPase
MERLVNDAKHFMRSEKWYCERGIPYRRGYLLYGIPGSGKTSFITALAGELRLNIYVINLGSQTMKDELLMELLAEAPDRCIILIEDIDVALWEVSSPSSASSMGSSELDASSSNEPKPSTSRVTFAGLLNALDGVAAQEGRLLFLTTNHPEKLNEALIRPGRVDVKAYFGYATTHQIITMVNRFYSLNENQLSKELTHFANMLAKSRISMAQLQGHLFKYENVEEALAKWSELTNPNENSFQHENGK